MKKQILIVDDEQNILEGLARMLRPFRHEWDVRLASSGEQALEIMAGQSIDIVVADMWMPGMSGSELLGEVRRLYPWIIRIILSGNADSELIVRSVGVTHQFLSKPCDPDTFKSIVLRAVGMRALLEEPNLNQLIAQMDALPSLPELYYEVVRELQAPEASIEKVGEIISRDPGMTAKILQLVNSAFFGLRRKISHPAEAVSYLGVDRILQLCLIAHAFSQFDRAKSPWFSIDDLWEHSTKTASLASRITRMEGAARTVTDDAFTAGLLHDIGKLLLCSKLPRQYEKTLIRSRLEQIPSWRAEREAFGTTHAEIGAYLLGLWGLPDPIIEAIAYHHRPSGLSGGFFCALTAVHAADALEHQKSEDDVDITYVETPYLFRLGLTDRLSAWRELADAPPARGDTW